MDAIKKFLFIKRSEKGFIFFNKYIENKPYFFFGKKSVLGLLIVIFIYYVDKEGLGFNKPHYENILIVGLIIIVSWLWIKDYIDYKKF